MKGGGMKCILIIMACCLIASSAIAANLSNAANFGEGTLSRSDLYARAIVRYNAKEFEQSLKLFNSMGDYEDSLYYRGILANYFSDSEYIANVGLDLLKYAYCSLDTYGKSKKKYSPAAMKKAQDVGTRLLQLKYKYQDKMVNPTTSMSAELNEQCEELSKVKNITLREINIPTQQPKGRQAATKNDIMGSVVYQACLEGARFAYEGMPGYEVKAQCRQFVNEERELLKTYFSAIDSRIEYATSRCVFSYQLAQQVSKNEVIINCEKAKNDANF